MVPQKGAEDEKNDKPCPDIWGADSDRGRSSRVCRGSGICGKRMLGDWRRMAGPSCMPYDGTACEKSERNVEIGG